jgi:NTE family protein
MLFTRFLVFAMLALINASYVFANPDFNVMPEDRPKIGLVLSGGGARGSAHVGVLHVLEEMRIPIDIITGTSMGAVTGGLYAYGYSPAELESKLVNTDWNDLFQDSPPRRDRSFRRKQDDYNFLIKLEAGFKDGALTLPTGLIQGQKLDIMLRSLMPGAPENFDELPIRFRAIAEDIESGEVVVMGDGDMTTAMRASMSIPGAFSPVERDGRLLVDGGFANNLPVQLAREMGADILIVVDLTGKLSKRDKLTSPLSILNQNMGFMIKRNTQEQLNTLEDRDILIQPDLDGYSSTDFWRAAEMIKQGVIAARLHSSRLGKLSLTKTAFQGRLSLIRSRESPARIIDKIVINNDSKLATSVIRSFISIQPGEILNIVTLESDLQQLFGLNIFERVSYKVTHVGNQSILTIYVRKKGWGPNYIRFGMNLESNFEGRSIFNLASSFTSTPLNAYGGEWRTELQIGHDQYLSTEFYQPLGNTLKYFLSAKAIYSETHFAIYESGEQISDYKTSSSTIRLAAGRDFGNKAQLQFGLTKGKGDTHLLIGSRPAPEQDFNIGAWFANIAYDQLDSINFPKHGALISATWVGLKESLGADADQDLMQFNALWAETWGRHTMLFWAGMAAVVNSNIPAADAFSMGGFLNISGYRKDELTGRYAGIARLIYLNEIGGKGSILKIPVYVGGSLETGNTWNNKDDINSTSLITAGSLVIAFDTPAGPLYLAKGFADGGKSAYYFFLGRSFTLL